MAPRHRWRPARPPDSRIEVRDIDDERAAKLLLRVRERAVLHDQLTANEGDSCGRVRLLEDLGAGEHACVFERFRVFMDLRLIDPVDPSVRGAKKPM